MNCPVCQNVEMREGDSKCSSCGSDLDAFHHISQIQKQRKRSKFIVIGLTVIAGLAVVGLFAKNAKVNDSEIKEFTKIQKEQGDQQILEQMNLSNEVTENTEEMIKTEGDSHSASSESTSDSESEIISSESPEIEETISSESQTIHVVEEGESLWTISEKYYGNGGHYMTLANTNGIDNADFISVGDELIIQPKP